jgi:hypothetical protein
MFSPQHNAAKGVDELMILEQFPLHHLLGREHLWQLIGTIFRVALRLVFIFYRQVLNSEGFTK